MTENFEQKLRAYQQFIAKKRVSAPDAGHLLDAGDVNPILKPHQRDQVLWGVRKGSAAIFDAFGLGKTIMQLEIARLVLLQAGGRFLIVAPLGVHQEFSNDAANLLGINVTFVRRIEECTADGIYITNYETIRDQKLDPRHFTGISLDEAAVLRAMGSSKTCRSFMDYCEQGQVKYKFIATATPSPNEYIELAIYAQFLDVMSVSEVKTRFFKRDSTKADELTLHKHKEREFWLWMSSWAVFLQKPSDLNPAYSDAGYTMPGMNLAYHEIPTNHENAGWEVYGQGKLIKDAAISLSDAAHEKRDSLQVRVAKVMEILAAEKPDQVVIWCDLDAEQRAIEQALKQAGISCSSLYGTLKIEERHKRIQDWKSKKTCAFLSKLSMYGAGINLQQCAHMIFPGVGYKFYDWLQGIHRCVRFLQTRVVRIDIIYTEAERQILRVLMEKWEQHKVLTEEMSKIIREYGLARNAMQEELGKAEGIEPIYERGENFTLVNGDSVIETMKMETNSVGLILTSIPFSSQYEYTPSLNDFGNSESNEEFFEQMDYLTPELLRVLKPGCDAAIHVKDRIVPGGLKDLGFQTVYPFHCDTIYHFIKHGFTYLGMATIVTDVVRENNQTYRLGWSEQCKDGTRMGYGMPEYMLIFRKPPTDASNGYADEPVLKDKPECIARDGSFVPFDLDLPIHAGTGYSRSRWQIDAHSFERSSGDRALTSEDLVNVPHSTIFKLFRQFSASHVYDYEHHVALCESLEARMSLPTTFMLLQPQSWHPDVWSDVTRMMSLNSSQAAKGWEMHLCPLQFDLADRVIHQRSNPGDIVYDPFAGLGTVAIRALKKGRRGLGVELNHGYFTDAVAYCRIEENKVSMPGLFDLLDAEQDVTSVTLPNGASNGTVLAEES